jgi:hypothetical protein
MNISSDRTKVAPAVYKVCATRVAYIVFISVNNILGSIQRFQKQSLCFVLDIGFCFPKLIEVEQTDNMIKHTKIPNFIFC